MSDERLRKLEQAWKKSGSSAEEARWLRERVRCGDGAPERMYFPGNPWPAGHRVKKLVWSGRLEETGVWFDLDLETGDYDEGDRDDDDEEEELDDDWKAKIVWMNYHACHLDGRFLAGTADEKLDLARLPEREFRIDPMPAKGASAAGLDPEEDLAFQVYLLGHDTVADHRIRFPLREDASTFWLSWRGRIALTYAGHDDFEHRFELPLRRVKFGGIELPARMREPAARELLGRFVKQPDALKLGRARGKRCFIL